MGRLEPGPQPDPNQYLSVKFSGWESVDTGSGTEMVGCGAGFTGLWTDLAGSYRVPDRLLTEMVGELENAN